MRGLAASLRAGIGLFVYKSTRFWFGNELGGGIACCAFAVVFLFAFFILLIQERHGSYFIVW